MVHFHKLINYLSNEQRKLTLPKSNDKNDNDKLFDFLETVKCLNKQSFDLIQSRDNFSIINSALNLLTVYPTNYEALKAALVAYLTQYVIVFSSTLKDYGLNSTKLNYQLDSGLDSEDLLLLIALAFGLNIIVINSNGKCKVFSPVNLDRFYFIVYQDSRFKYHAVKYQANSSESSTFMLNSLNLLEPDHPLVTHCLSII